MTCTDRVVNGGFESGDLTGWTEQSFEISTFAPHSGTYCAKMNTVDSPLHWLYQSFTPYIEVDDISTATVYLKYTGIRGTRELYISFLDDTTGWHDVDISTNVTTSWTSFDLKSLMVFVGMSGTKLREISIGCSGTGAYDWVLYVDDLVILECPVVPPPVTGPPQLILRVDKVEVKGECLKGVINADWKDSNPWVKLPIVAGPNYKQHLRPNDVSGYITCCDVTSIWTAFYNSGIIDESTGEKTKFSTSGDEFAITMVDMNGTPVVFDFWDVRIETIELKAPETEGGNMGVWIITFSASLVIKE